MNVNLELLQVTCLPVGYIGPGAGFAFLGSFMIMFAAILLALGAILSFPFRLLIHAIIRTGKNIRPKVKRVIIIGLDGFDPELAWHLMDRGDLPNLKELKQEGCFSKLTSTCPPISPVAWSSFATGVNPGKHNIFDFLNRNPRTYIPELSSCRIEQAGGKQGFALLRKSKTFWEILGQNGIFSTILRVPVTFPPEKFNGLSLSGMCTPDLQGTQGTFTLYESNTYTSHEMTGGYCIHVLTSNSRVSTSLPGPSIKGKILKTGLNLWLEEDTATLQVSGKKIKLKPGIYSDWVTVQFRSGLHSINGICRFLLLSIWPHFRMYVTPVNIDPEHPAMPISHPSYYSTYLAKLNGPYATLGLAEDTWALNEGILSEDAFMQQVYDIHEEREKMFLNAVKRTRKGLCCCVFDASDRVQHMFRIEPQPQHPSRMPHHANDYSDTISNVYRRLDVLVGKTMRLMDNDTVLFVISDHGFTDFNRGVDLNVWLKENGYLALKDKASGGKYLADIDWKKTRAYSFGLSGIYLNMQEREARGIVTHDEKDALKTEIMQKLKWLTDPKNNKNAVHALMDADKIYSGPYKNNGPDIIVGFSKGYRASWNNATGLVQNEVFTDNTKHWNGDHCVDRDLVPGVFFCNRKVTPGQQPPALMDMAPTVLDLFGMAKPDYMDGNILKIQT